MKWVFLTSIYVATESFIWIGTGYQKVSYYSIFGGKMWPFWQEMSEEIGTRGFEKSQGVGSQNWESSSFGVATNIEKIVIAASDVHARNKHLFLCWE